ncbi:hypothetical protein ACFVAJ_17650 [Agromyces sp. NPDC057679]|uniref:hypothetical protein n=1 Tax=Agromyces sp. NPDC057679 TaxID=3346207 RepID=UPI00366FA1F3
MTKTATKADQLWKSYTPEQQAMFNSAADELYQLRTGFAYETQILDEVLEFKSFPAKRRQIVEATISRFKAIANGNEAVVAGAVDNISFRQAEKASGADQLDDAAWEQEDLALRTLLLSRAQARTLAWYFARVGEAHTLGASLPKKAAALLTAQAERLRRMAAGDANKVNAEVAAAERESASPRLTEQNALRLVGAPALLTNWQLLEQLTA